MSGTSKVIHAENSELLTSLKEPPMVNEGWAEHGEDVPPVLRLKEPPDKLKFSVFYWKKLLSVLLVKRKLK